MILYTTNCVKCKILERMLDEKGIEYTKETDISRMLELGFKTSPVLEVGLGIYLPFDRAVTYLKDGGFASAKKTN